MDEKPIDPASTSGRLEKKPFQVKSLILVVACAAGFFFAYKKITDEMKPNSDLVHMIESSEPSERVEGASRLGMVEPQNAQDSIVLLIEKQPDSNSQVRAKIALSLGTLTLLELKTEEKPKQPKAKEAVLALTKALEDESEDVRWAAVDSIDRIVKASTPETFPTEIMPVASTLTGVLNDPSEYLRRSARATLSAFGTKLAIAPPAVLVEMLAKGKLADSRALAAFALGSFQAGTEPTVKALITALKDEDAAVRSNSAISLGKFGLASVSALPSLAALSADPFVPPVIPPPRPSPFVAVAAPAGGPMGGGVEKIPPADPATQAAKAIGLIAEAQAAQGEMAPLDVATALYKTLKASRPDLVNGGKEAFQKARKGASAAIPELVKDLNESIPDADSPFGPVAAVTLGDIGPDSPMANDAIAALISALGAKSHGTRLNAVTSLGRFGPAAVAAIPKLKEAAEADKELETAVKTAIDRLEGKSPPEAPQRKGGRGGRGGAGSRAKGA